MNVVAVCIMGGTKAIVAAACTDMNMISEDVSLQGPRRLIS